jgi:hypothetical protein
MNPDLYTEEYRNFRFLKSDHEKVEYFKKEKKEIDKIQPWNQEFNPTFSWKHRVEFIEQIFDLRDDIVYIVSSPALRTSSWEMASLVEIKQPIILTANPVIHGSAKEATLDDISSIEDNKNHWFCLCERKQFENNLPQARVIRLSSLPVVPSWIRADFISMFYNKETAEEFRRVLTEVLRHKANAMSSFSAKL